jgi:hypothetical protein
MELRTDAVQQECRAIARQMRDYSRNLGLSFIVHHTGQHLESLALAGQELLTHPGANSALRLLKSAGKNENSAFLGLSIWYENLFFGLASRQNMMALFTLNSDEFTHLRFVRAQAWSMAWHAINLYNNRYNPIYADAFEDGLVAVTLEGEELARANLKADVFSAIMCSLNEGKNMINDLVYRRSMESIGRNAGHKPEFFPFPISADATEFAFREMQRHPPSKKKQIQTALQIAENIGKAYDELSLQQWIYFCKPAQDMAWRGETKETILGAAVSTSQDTYIRATGFLVADAIKVKPASIIKLENTYSPFAEEKYNQRLHETMLERAFEQAVNAGLINLDGSAFSEAANAQNEKLSDGHILGWCAAALQAAGSAFENAVIKGSKNPDQDARREFEGLAVRTTWDTLKEIGETIIEQYRQGYATTFSDLIDFCDDRPAFAGISSSIAFTMKDPSYLKKLDIANDLKMMPAPEAAPAAPAPKGPSFFAAPKLGIPGFGLGGAARSAPVQTREQPKETSDS